MADDINFVIEQGADWAITLFEQNDDGTPVLFDGCAAVLNIASLRGAPVPFLSLSTDDGSLQLGFDAGRNAGTIAWRVSAAVTSTYVAQIVGPVPGAPDVSAYLLGFYNIEVTSYGGQVVREHAGRIYLDPDT